MRKILLSVAGAAVALSLAASAHSATIVMDFDTITTGASVDAYYAGGTDSLGEIGPNYGVTFTPGDWITATGFGQTSQPNLAYSESGGGQVDVTGGFTSLSFTYGAFANTTISVYSGLGGTGLLLGQITAPANDPSAFDPDSVPFAGVAYSIVISGGAGQFGWDDVTLNLAEAVPEPATWTVVLAGLGMLMMARRRVLGPKA
jgi:hypothetical protein